MGHKFERYCKEYENIENYEAAKKDNFKGWVCHHRKGVYIARKKLKALGMYYNRPASELIFLTESEHHSLHQKGKKFSEEAKNKISEAMKGENNPFYGKHHTDETRRKMSEAWDYDKHFSTETKNKISEAHKGNKYALGYKHSEESKKKMSEAKKGMHWFNNGKISKIAYECPDGFTPGRLNK